ncbi:MAG: clostripain-related cysteine peptidase [candidate division WOR-3 bacterium]
MKKLPFFLIFFFLPHFLISKILFIGYFCADNNLYNGFLKNYNQLIESSKKIKNTDIIIFLDSPFYSFIFKIYDGRSETLKVFDNVNSGDFHNISNFFSTFYKYDYDKRIMVLWDHGNGWYNFTSKDKSIFFDNHPFDFISITDGEFKNIFLDIYKKTKKKTDILIFDACLMQSIEVVYEIKDYVSYIIGSEGIVPYNGFPYDKILQSIDTLNNLEDISITISEQYFEHYYDSTSYKDLTVSTIKTESIVRDIDKLKFTDRNNFSIIDETDVSCNLKNSVIINLTKNEKFKGIKLFYPLNFSTLYKLYKDYINLSIDKDFQIIKKEFLSYGINDTFSPLPVNNIELAKMNNNNFKITFDPSYDFSIIKNYNVEFSNAYDLYTENFDSLPENFTGNFCLTDQYPYSKPFSLFTRNFVFEIFLSEEENIISFKYKGLFSDSSFFIYLNGEPIKSFEGELVDWKPFYFITKKGLLKIEFNKNLEQDFYLYLDDLKIYKIKDLYRTILNSNAGTVHKIGYGENILFVTGVDEYNNVSDIDTVLEFFVNDTIESYVFPNPAVDEINIFSEFMGMYRVTMFAVDGKRIFENSGIKTENFIKIDINNFKTGLYYYILEIENRKMKGKFFVER